MLFIDAADALLHALAEQLAAAGERFELVVIGGSALQALGLVSRPTRDVDIVALRQDSRLRSAAPLPPAQERLSARRYSDSLTVHVAGRLDQIHFKLYALVDLGAGKHEADLRALAPTPTELVMAARWTRTHDPSPGFR